MKELEGFEELARSFGNLSRDIPQKDLGKAVKKGAVIVQSEIKKYAPKRYGDLRSGIILHKEKSRTKGKVGYDIMMDPDKNSIFQKPIMNPVRSTSPYAYYPASQEYGFFTRRPGGGMTYNRSDGSKVTMNKVPGKHYMLAGAETVSEVAKTAVGEEILEVIQKELQG